MTLDFATLSDDTLLDLLSDREDQVPRAAVDEILKRSPRLASRLAALAEDDELWEIGDWAPLHALFLLAAARPPGSLEVLLGALDREDLHEDGFLVDAVDSMLASFGAGAVPDLIAAFERGGSYPRIWIDDALGLIAGTSPAEVRTLIHEHLKAVALGDAEVEVRACAAEVFARLATASDRETLEILVDRRLLDSEDAQEALTGTPDEFAPRPVDWLRFYDSEALARRLEGLYEGDDDADDPEDDGEDLEGVLPDTPLDGVLNRMDAPGVAPPPLVNTGPKVGRNDPCPCGSGKKFKKCCAR